MLDRVSFSTALVGIPIIVGFFVIAVLPVFKWTRRAGSKHPPGPKGVPFFGNLFQLSKQDFEEWGHKYGSGLESSKYLETDRPMHLGDMTYLEAFGQGILLLNSHTAAVDLLDRRSGIYSDRPSFIVINALTRGLFLGATSYGDISSISLLLSTVYDVPPTLSLDDPLIKKFNDFDNLIIEAAYPGNYLVEFFGLMKFLPSIFAPWKRKAEKGFLEFSAFFEQLCRDIKKQHDAGDEKPGIAGYIIREQRRLGLSDAESAWLPATFANGSASVAEALQWFFLAMVAFPEKQRKCQEELDAVVGRSRMPTVEDGDNLPYMKATLRFFAGTQHVTRQDDWYQGYFIPKGTMCFAHIWLMNRDKKKYGLDAEDFNPGRFLDNEGNFVPIAGDTKDVYLETEGHVAYGFGPRICPGRYFANDALFIIFARLLWAATISPAVDQRTGKPHLPALKDTIGEGITMRPSSFEIVVEPRFSEAVAMVAQTKELCG
ncbi:hypothetical protein M413DRAFT_23364 [Hebeloma cylindrosporum]|uniref:Cytochrome P450 n=1 Tax=Hebeloma cylindrosporum TaxID=76867 RepID=A0A0C3CTA7_HEBCY|nr:hypothetical protein M413DRAFT_23364 [Hebeloma cylindrosporum h7]